MDLPEFFSSKIAGVEASSTAKAYIVGLFTNQASRPIDLSKESIVLTYASTKRIADFRKLQALGDWVLWIATVFPESIEPVIEVAESVGRISYYRCYKMVPSWRVYEELSDTLPVLVPQLRGVLQIDAKGFEPISAAM